MRSSPFPLASLLVVASLLAGCTSDGNLGGIDPGQQQRQAEERAASIWEPAAAAHVADVTMGGGTLDVSPGFAPFFLRNVSLRAVSAGVTHLALRGAVHEGERGWVVVDATGATPPAILDHDGEGVRLVDYAIHADGSDLSARLLGSTLTLVHIPPLCPPSSPAAFCDDARAAEPPAKPAAFENATIATIPSALLDGNVTFAGSNARFYPAGDASETAPRDLAPGHRVELRDATLVAFTTATPFFDSIALSVPLDEAPATAWAGNVTVEAIAPTGTLELASGPRLLALHNSAAFTMRGQGNATLARGELGWELAAQRVELVDVRTGGGPHLEATLRLAPDLVNVTGPAGNVTRVQLILAETSGGAHAHLLGYRIDPSVRARFVGHEPFAVTNALLQLLNETEGPITPVVLLAVGVSVPFFAIGEAFVAFATALFPPSLAGPLSAGEARLLTFEIVMPATPQDVEILIEAANAEPTRATLRMQPVK